MSSAIRFGRALALAATLLFTSLPDNATAQSAPSYEVHNTSNETLTFSTLDPARGTWKAQSIHPNERKSFVYNSGAAGGKVRIATGGRGYVEYDVQVGQRYAVVWDATKGVWDFRSRGAMHAGGGNASPMRAVSTGAGQQGNAWTLHNKTNERVAFQTLDPTRGTWKDQVSYPHQSSPYTMSPGAANGRIRVATQNRGYVEYDVHAGGVYNLIWDERKGVWDFRTVRRGG